MNRSKLQISVFLLIVGFLASCGTAVAGSPSAFARHRADATARFLDELRSGPRFLRDGQGVISDRQTGLQWLEGPDHPTSWEQAQAWINGLGDGWRTPTLEELAALYLPDSSRRGTYGDPLCLDPAFERDSGYSLWSIERYDGTAWLYDFSRGYAHWIDTHFPGRFDRAIAVRNP